MNALESIPGLETTDGEPVFAEPWEANAFAIVLELNAKQVFTWEEWAETLGQTLKENGSSKTYYQSWLDALQTILEKKMLLGPHEIKVRKQEWAEVVSATPHGKPIELKNRHSKDL